MKTLAAILFLFMLSGAAYAQPVYQASADGITITLYNEKCELDQFSNLPFKATWSEKGKTFHGCFGVFGNDVVAYFVEDGTVAKIPASVFTKLQSI